MKKILIIGLVLAIAAGFYGYRQYNKPAQGVDASAVAHKVVAADLLNEFSKDETTANGKYLDKVIEVSGNIKEVTTDGQKTTVILDAQNDMGNVVVELFESMPLDSTHVGKPCVVVGQCTGYLDDVQLSKAKISIK